MGEGCPGDACDPCQLSERYGPVFTVHLGCQKTVVLTGFEVVKEALAGPGQELADRPPIAIFQLIQRGGGRCVARAVGDCWVGGTWIPGGMGAPAAGEAPRVAWGREGRSWASGLVLGGDQVSTQQVRCSGLASRGLFIPRQEGPGPVLGDGSRDGGEGPASLTTPRSACSLPARSPGRAG